MRIFQTLRACLVNREKSNSFIPWNHTIFYEDFWWEESLHSRFEKHRERVTHYNSSASLPPWIYKIRWGSGMEESMEEGIFYGGLEDSENPQLLFLSLSKRWFSSESRKSKEDSPPRALPKHGSGKIKEESMRIWLPSATVKISRYP